MRRSGIVSEKSLNCSSTGIPEVLALAESISMRRSVIMGPGAILLTVIPYGARSVAIVLAMTVTPARTESETTRSVRGSFTPYPVRLTMRPRPEAFKAGNASRMRRTALIKIELVGGIPVIIASLFEGGSWWTAGISDEAIQTTQCGNSLGHNALDLCRVGNV